MSKYSLGLVCSFALVLSVGCATSEVGCVDSTECADGRCVDGVCEAADAGATADSRLPTRPVSPGDSSTGRDEDTGPIGEADGGMVTPAPECTRLAPSFAAGRVQLPVRALIDGNSRFVIDGDKAWWHHVTRSQPGWDPDVPGSVSPTCVGDMLFAPGWPGAAPNQGCDCESEGLVGVPRLLAGESSVVQVLEVEGPEGAVRVVEQPSADNGYRLVLEISDARNAGAHWFEFLIDYEVDPEPIARCESSEMRFEGDRVTVPFDVRVARDTETTLVVDDAGAHWEHDVAQAPGRLGPYSNVPICVGSTEWVPGWPSTGSNRDCNCSSSTHEGVPPMPWMEQLVTLSVTSGDVRILEQPTAENRYRFVLGAYGDADTPTLSFSLSYDMR